MASSVFVGVNGRAPITEIAAGRWTSSSLLLKVTFSTAGYVVIAFLDLSAEFRLQFILLSKDKGDLHVSPLVIRTFSGFSDLTFSLLCLHQFPTMYRAFWSRSIWVCKCLSVTVRAKSSADVWCLYYFLCFNWHEWILKKTRRLVRFHYFQHSPTNSLLFSRVYIT